MNNRDNIAKAYDSNAKEHELYQLWAESGIFSPEKSEERIIKAGIKPKKPFTMTLPPPNANGDLHVGHMCGYSFHDLLGRYYRMHGHPTLLLPGKDHASIQTEAVFVKHLEKQGKSKWELGREEFFKQCYDFCMNNADNARTQEKRIGLSADWSRELFTLDPKLTDIIYETFFRLYKDGLIYRDKYLINQCPHCRTALADVDTDHKEMSGIFAYIIYPFVDEEDNDKAEKVLGQRGVVVATTRPETMLGDTAVAVNPEDPRYKDFIGHKIRVPFVNRDILIIADEASDMSLGSGAVKVTPAHSPIDFELGKKHNLEIINVIGPDGKMTAPAPTAYIGMGTIECSKALVAELDKMGLLIKIERVKHEVAVCERCETPIEPIISNQWFINTKPLAEKALEALKSGETKVIPSGSQIALEKFFTEIRPWCVSRQLWWGQRIPIWYSGGKELYDWLHDNPGKTVVDYETETGKKARGTGKIFASVEQPATDPDWHGLSVNEPDGLIIEQEQDIFDTWFSSGQWPVSTLGGVQGDDFKKYYPTDVMLHGRDILFWWSARMMMLGTYLSGKAPFKTVYLTGMILAPDGQKMSKSKGNGIEPLYLIDKYGADALRLWYYIDSLPGNNTPIREEKIKGNRNFVNKIWNASRFVLMNIEDSEIPAIILKMSELENEWESADISDEKGYSAEITDKSINEIGFGLTKWNVQRVAKYIEKFKINLGAEAIREFFWHQICDVWIEQVKKEIAELEVGSETRIDRLARLLFVVKEYLAIMHPFLPYVTEAVWQELVALELADGILAEWVMEG